MRSYLRQREQYVSIGDCRSGKCNIDYGVPQGSILGPLLFVIYVNDLPEISRIAKFVLYADDANIIICGKNIFELEEKIKQLTTNLQNWVDKNGLKMNLKKTKYMIIANKHISDIDIEIDNTKIERVTHEKFLGIIIDDKLNWNMHRNILAAKISRNAGILFRLKGTVPQSIILTLYYSFVQSHLCYCPMLWGLGSNSSLKQIFAAQKKSIRAIEQNYVNYFYDQSTGELPGHTKAIFSKYKIFIGKSI